MKSRIIRNDNHQTLHCMKTPIENSPLAETITTRSKVKTPIAKAMALKGLAVVGAAWLLLIVCGPAARAQTIKTETYRIPNPSGGGGFGEAVSISGNVAGVGNLTSSDLYILRFNGTDWVEESNIATGAGVSPSVSISGSLAVGGWWSNTVPVIGVYVSRYNGSTWDPPMELTAQDASGYGAFGYSVSVSGDVVVAGEPYVEAAHVFRYNGSNWDAGTKLTAPDAGAYGHFGNSVSVSGDVVVVGELYANNLQGAAYVFRYNGSTWDTGTKLTAPDGGAYDQFGNSVSVSGDVVLVGAPVATAGGDLQRHGAAYVFRYNGSTWDAGTKITASDGAWRFGNSVSVSGSVMLIGAPSSQAAYVFTNNAGSWVEVNKLVASDSAYGFGASVAVSDNFAIVGATSANAAYVFVLQSADTGTGSGVAVTPLDPQTQTSATVSFDNVASPGVTFINVIDPTQAPPWPSGSLNVGAAYFELATTAEFSGQVHVGFNYSNLSGIDEATLRLWHYENGAWQDVTDTSVSPNPNTTTKTIYGVVSSLSPFALVSQGGAATKIAALVAGVQALPIEAGLKKALTTKLQAAQADVEDHDNPSACNVMGAFVNQVNAQAGKKLTAAQASQLVNAVTPIRTALGCK